jgi:hypothetical protein
VSLWHVTGVQTCALPIFLVLSWSAPTDNGGSNITGYRIYQGTSSGSETLLQTVQASLMYYANSGLTNGQVYYFKVCAINAAGEGASSSETQGTPTAQTSSATPGYSIILTIGLLALASGIIIARKYKSIQ